MIHSNKNKVAIRLKFLFKYFTEMSILCQFLTTEQDTVFENKERLCQKVKI